MRKGDAVSKANAIMQDFETLINNEVVPIEAATLLGGDTANDEVRRRARLCSQCYPFSARAQLLCVYIELQHVRALDLAADRKRHLRRILALVSDAAVTFDCSLLIALFHAKVLFVLDEFDESERECRRALRIEEPTDPNLDDIPPAHVRALDLAADRKRHLRRILALVSDAAVTFDCSLLIALFHAKVLFVLDEFDESERECRRALRIEEPTDPNLDDIPPAVSVPGADFDARVSSVKKELRVFLKHIVVVAALYWCSIKSTPHHERIISVKVQTLQEHYNGIDQSAAKTISDALRFLKNQGSWSFFICPSSRCDGKKFLDTRSLWQHMRNKHRDELWEKLQSVLGPDFNENASKDDHSLDGITLCQDSGQHDIFQLPEVQDMFESLLVSPSIGIRTEPLAEMRQRKWREGSEILEDIKEKLKMLPKDTLSTEFEGFCFGIQNLWLKFLKVSLLDYREVILPLARSFQWIEIKQWIAQNVNDPNRSISDASFDAVFGKVPAALDHQSGDDLQPEKLKPSCADETLKADEKFEESEVRVVNSNSGTVVDQSSSDPPTDVDESVMNIAVRIADVELDKKGDSNHNFFQHK
uniref:Uncharacterized protein n=1 Tax=Avena sativa TaxID=4498 RepID=A0ACD5Y739_AVESA